MHASSPRLGQPVLETLESRTLCSATTLDDYQYAPGRSTSNLAGTVDAAGNVFVGGWATDGTGAGHALVREGVRQADGTIAFQATPAIDLANPYLAGGSLSF